MKCFSLHVAAAYSSITREKLSAAQLEEYMQYRYNLFNTVVNHLNGNEHAMTVLEAKQAEDLNRSKDARIDPDYNTNPAFWSNIDLMKEFAQNVGDSSNSCMWSFLLLPLELQEFNYLIITTVDHQDPSGCKAVKRVQPTYYFISEKPKASTIYLMYQGRGDGHFTSLLIPNYKSEEFKKAALSVSNSCFTIRFTKPREGLWKPIADVYQDLSLADFVERKLPKVVICLPSAAPVNPEIVHIESSQSQASKDKDDGGAATAVQAPSIAGDAAAAKVSAIVSDDPKLGVKMHKTLDKVRIATERIEELCNRADSYSLQTLDSTNDNLKNILQELDDICSQLEEHSISIPQRDQQALERSGPAGKIVVEHFRLICPRIATVLGLRDKIRSVIEATKKPKAKSKTAKAAATAAAGCLPLDYMLRIKSNFAADDVSDDINDNQLLSLFRITPIPTSLISFYFSLVHVAAEPNIRTEMEEIFQSPIDTSKQFASEIHRLTRDAFDSVGDKPMVRGGKTFNQYLEYKGASSWAKIPNDHVLGEISLCCQVWKLNIALIWKRNGIWKLFVCAHGGNSPILCLLYACTRVQLQITGQSTFEPGPTCRFFPIFALDDNWFDNDLFVATIPNSIQEGESEVIVEFNARVHREFQLQSVVAVEGNASPDESSCITAELSASQLLDSFVDSDSVSQGDLPTPPEIRAIPIQTIANTVNAAMALPLQRITRRRRIIISESEGSSQQSSRPAAMSHRDE